MCRKGSWRTKGERKVGKMFEKKGLTVIYQHKLGPYNLDIFLPELNTNIEVHGPHHVISSRIARDQLRTEYIQEMGYKQYVIHAQDTNNQGELREFAKRVLQESTRVPSGKKEIFNNSLFMQLQNRYCAVGSAGGS